MNMIVTASNIIANIATINAALEFNSEFEQKLSQTQVLPTARFFAASASTFTETGARNRISLPFSYFSWGCCLGLLQ